MVCFLLDFTVDLGSSEVIFVHQLLRAVYSLVEHMTLQNGMKSQIKHLMHIISTN